MIKNIIEYLIAISVIPAIVLTVISVTELKDVRNVQYELLSEEEGVFNITPGTYEKLVANKRIKDYELESNYPLITQEEMERVTWQVGDLKNEIFIDENGEKRIRENVGKIVFDGSENWIVLKTSDLSIVFVLWDDSFNTNSNLLQEGSYLEKIDGYTPDHEDEGFDIRDSGVIIQLSKTRGILTVSELKQYLAQNPLTVYYELADKQDRPVEVYDYSKFRLTYDKNRIRVVFDIDDGYYLWEITKDDKMIPINGQYDLGNIWTVKFYVYEIQQPLIRTLVLLIPLIVVSGVLLYMFNIIKKKGISY